jgi:transcriptional regulator GlxA family with amidase domain
VIDNIRKYLAMSVSGSYGRKMHSVVVLALDDTIAFDLATPIEIFERARLADGRKPYEVTVAGPRRTVTAGPVSLVVPHRLDHLASAHTIVVPGRNDPTAPIPDRVVRALRDAHAGGARIASICVGAFTLAATGLLDGRRATTHWQASELLRQRHPLIRVDADVLYVDDGQVLTSAGATAGVDLCLHLIARDFGAAVARTAARSAVAPITRDGGQAQYIESRGRGDDDRSLAATLAWIEGNLARPLSLEGIARHARLSTRTLSRRFREEIGSTPIEYVIRARIRLAQSLLETTSVSIDRVADESGFGTAANLRGKFAAALGTTPVAYRNTFRDSLT